MTKRIAYVTGGRAALHEHQSTSHKDGYMPRWLWPELSAPCQMA